MAPVPPSTSAIVDALFEAKTFITQHYLLVISAVIFARLFYLRYLSPYRDIPGPFLATISPLWRLRAALNGTLNNDITECHRKYGPIFRIAPDEVSISDPEAIKVIYAHGAGFTKVSIRRDDTHGRLTFTVSGEITKRPRCSRTPMKRPTPPNVVSLQTPIPCPHCSKWNPMSTARSRKCVPVWGISRIP